MLYINFILIYISNRKLGYKFQELKLFFAFLIGLFLFASFKATIISPNSSKYLVNGHEVNLESSSKPPISSFKSFRHKKLNKFLLNKHKLATKIQIINLSSTNSSTTTPLPLKISPKPIPSNDFIHVTNKKSLIRRKKPKLKKTYSNNNNNNNKYLLHPAPTFNYRNFDFNSIYFNEDFYYSANSKHNFIKYYLSFFVYF